jgi:hypothetical protein
MERMQRLPGRSIKYFGWGIQRHQLWLAEGYLLSREISVVQEEVRRYHYRDIQAIVYTPTNHWKTCNWLAGSLLVFLSCCGIFAAILGSTPAYILAAITAAAPLIVLLGNLLLGPSCHTVLYTAAAEAPLYSLGRQRGAEKAIARLLPFIQAAQRDEEARPAESAAASSGPGPEATIPPPPAPDPSDP